MLMYHKKRVQSSYLFFKDLGQNISLEKLQKYVCESNNKEFINRISRVLKTLQSTRPYWNLQRCQLEAIVHQINFLHLFFTCSDADTQ